ncbi:MAG: sulfurtransferase TusA family protein [Thermoplasmataceae archaeon]
MVTINVDSRGTACPGPLTDIIRAYRKARNGDVIVVLATDAGIKADSRSWCERTRNELIDVKEDAGIYTVTIKITGKREEAQEVKA